MQKILDALTKNRSQNFDQLNFFSLYNLDPQDCAIEVAGVGKIEFPLSKATIEQLLKISSEAKFGHKEKTLLDKKVRDTQEIKADQLNVTFNEQKFAEMLDTMREEMILPENAKLKASLHNMLVYKPGQFFKKHQDSEKLEGMVATLAVVLPSTHIGGDLVIEHGKDSYRFSSENIDEQEIQCIAFYADCQHAVRKVKQGYRVALTFNLVLENQDNSSSKVNSDLEKALADYFARPSSDSSPQFLVYLLDHEYTEHSLRFNGLKSVDNKNVSDFLSAAKRLGLVANLALIELHQMWTALIGEYNYYGSDKEDPEVDELIDAEQHLYYWIDRNNNKLPYGEYGISEEHICSNIDLRDEEPSDSEYQGYMGNYGDTMDFWYKRAALVLWPQEAQPCMGFILDYQNELKKLTQLTHTQGNEKQVKEIIGRVGRYLYNNSSSGFGDEHEDENQKYQKLLEIAYYVDDAKIAQLLIDHFKLTKIEKGHMAMIAKMQARYGTDWCLQRLKQWQGKVRLSYSADGLIENIDQLIGTLSQKECDGRLADLLWKYQLDHIIKSAQKRALERPKYIKASQTQRISYIEEMFKSMPFFAEDKRGEELVDHLLKNPVLYPDVELAKMVCSLHKSLKKRDESALDRLSNQLIQSMEQKLKQGPRTDSDWTIKEKLFCDGEYCEEANAFLSSNEHQKVWAIAMDIRKYIMDQFKDMELPVKLEVLKKGSPHKLIMTKTPKLHKEARSDFKKLQAGHAQLVKSMEAR